MRRARKDKRVSGHEPKLVQLRCKVFDFELPIAHLTDVAGDARLLYAMRGTALQIKDVVAFENDLGWDEGEACLAKRGGLAVKNVRISRAQ